MDIDIYLQTRLKTIRDFGKYAYNHGYHNDIEDDLMLFRNSKELNILGI